MATPADARAASAGATDVTVDTFNGLAAFIVPGDDAYSAAQGETVAGPGGVASGTVPYMIVSFDRGLAVSLRGTATGVPASQAAADLLNATALTVDPAAASGAFLSSFARLTFVQKGSLFASLERQADDNELGTALGGGLALVALMCYSEAAVFDPVRRRLSGVPVGCAISHFSGPAEGRAEFRGYWRGHRRATGGSPTCARPMRRPQGTGGGRTGS